MEGLLDVVSWLPKLLLVVEVVVLVEYVKDLAP